MRTGPGPPVFNATGEHRQFRSAAGSGGEFARESHSCVDGRNVGGGFEQARESFPQVKVHVEQRMEPSAGQGPPDFNATRDHRQIRSSLWPAMLGSLVGAVVELGPGAGGNLNLYQPGVRWLGIEPDAAARERLRPRLGANAQVLPGRAEELELDDGSVDAVVCSFVLCSVRRPATALAQIHRVLKPGGRFVFAEHVAGEKGTWVRRAQNLLAVAPTRCRPNRDTGPAIAAAGFTFVDLHRFDEPGPWGVGVPHITGSAEPVSKGQS